MANPFTALARVLGTKPWLMKLAGGIIWVDKSLHRPFKGKVSLVALAGLTFPAAGHHRPQERAFPRYQPPLLPARGEFRTRRLQSREAERSRVDTTCARVPTRSSRWGGKEIPVRARELPGSEYEAMWKPLLDFWPGYSMEERAARRVSPIFELTATI